MAVGIQPPEEELLLEEELELDEDELLPPIAVPQLEIMFFT